MKLHVLIECSSEKQASEWADTYGTAYVKGDNPAKPFQVLGTEEQKTAWSNMIIRNIKLNELHQQWLINPNSVSKEVNDMFAKAAQNTAR